jgi:hypothetical protein
MADKKISQLTALSAANLAPSTDVLAIVDTSATETKKVTAKDLVDGALNGGTANGVLYLNGSKVATSGSAFVFDGTNLGLGVTPSLWRSTEKAIQIGSWMGLFTDSGVTTEVSYNNYINSSNQRIYQNTGYALRYQQYNGIHSWHTAPSGTAGNQITGANAFVQTMTLDASGNLLVGTTTGSNKLTVNGDAVLLANGDMKFADATNTHVSLITNSGAASTSQLEFWTGNPVSERARITSGGYFKASDAGTYLDSAGSYHELRQSANFLCADFSATNASYTERIITTRATKAAATDFKFISSLANAVEQFYVRGDGVLYAQNTTIQSLSDGRLKENVRNATEGLNVVNALRPVRYDWKAGYGNDRKDQLGFIAQEVEAVFPDAVSEWSKAEGDEEPYKTVGPGALIPVLVKAIQEQQAMIKSLEAKVAALEAK